MKSDEKKRQHKMAQLGQEQPWVAGSLNRVQRKDNKGRTTTYWLLTSKVNGKTKSVYVPKDLVKDVQRWVRNHRRIKELLAGGSTLSEAIIRNHVKEERAAAAKRRPKNRST